MTPFRIIFLAIAIAAILGTSYVAWRGYAPDTSGRTVSLRLGSGTSGGLSGFGFNLGRVK